MLQSKFNKSPKLAYLILLAAFCISLVLHLRVFNLDLIGYHVWRQTQTMQNIENFARQDFSILNPRINSLLCPDGLLRMEFPIYQWCIAAVCKMGSNHVLIARIITFIIGLFSMWGFYLFVKRLTHDKLLAALGSWILCFSPVFYYYTVNPLPDNMGLCFGIYGLYFTASYFQTNSPRDMLGLSLFIGLAGLCKLPYILLLIPVGMYWLRHRKITHLLFLGAGVLLCFAWYASVIGKWQGNGILKGVLGGNTTAGEYLHYVQGIFVSVIPELFINYAALPVFVAGLILLLKNKILQRKPEARYLLWGITGVFAYVFFELNMITTVHDYYLLPLLPFLILVTLYGFRELCKHPFWKWLAYAGILIMPLTAYLRINTRWNLDDPGFNKELLIHKEAIRKCIPPNAICLTGNDDSNMINLYYLDRKGYSFENDSLNTNVIKSYMDKGVSYLVSDARLNEETNRFLGKPVAEFNDLKIFKLK